jgi:hypothetical protein
MAKFIIVFSLLFPCISYAQDGAVFLKKGEQVPFNGVLLPPDVQAKMIADSEYNKKVCALETNYLSMRQKTTCDFEKNSMKIDLDTLNKKYDLVTKLKDDEITRLNKNIVDNSKSSDRWVWWLAGGVVSGIALTVAVTYAVTQTTK